MTGHPAPNRFDGEIDASTPCPFEIVHDFDVAWATAHPERALTLLFIAPRPCAALDRLIGA